MPGLIVQALMAAVVVGYYWHPPTRDVLVALGAMKATYGYFFSMVISIVCGALLPEVFNVLVFQRARIRMQNWANLRFTMVYWAFDGMFVDALYQWQGHLFGDVVTGSALLKKVLFDQFVVTPFVFMPISLLCYEWKQRDFVFSGMSEIFTWRFARDRGIPALITCWAVWIPVLFAVYALPPLLQIPMFALALTIWVMLFTYMTASGRDGESVEDER